ncbi:acyltransferase [Butyrivibrio fibrisolvens]|uniref:acyltransferase n=1 Tax=Butyrivibrio fibrisolvens TaxID=831 RepID=UPI00040D2B6A|nr:acyltransferase family protein [Butyrivibrio fibrisolvens]
MNKSVDKNTSRIIYLDYLRIISAFFIIIIHVAAQNKYVTDVNSYEWQVFNVYDGMSRWAVSVFIMISGALFLNKDVSIKDMYMKYVFKMLTVFLFWSLIYAIYSNGKDVGEIIYAVIHGHYHMWFILMITGLYICTPIIKLVKDNTRIMLYFMVLALIFSIIIPQMKSLVNDFGNNWLKNSG